jgi:hypothetical protein
MVAVPDRTEYEAEDELLLKTAYDALPALVAVPESVE